MDDSQEGGDWDPQIRREQRREMRQIIQDVQENRDEMTMPDDLVKNVKKMNTVFRDVVSTREAAIDAEGFQLLSAIGKEQAESSAGELVFDPMVFAEKLLTFMGGRRGEASSSRELDWAKLGEKVSACFETPPSLSFLHGALDLTPIIKKQRQSSTKRKAGSEATTSKPKELTEFEEEEESTTKDVAHIFCHLKRVCGDKGRVHYYSFLVDPESFSRTVENMFHFSFLVKDGRAGIEIDPNEHQPYIYLPQGGKSERRERGQAIISINMAQWKRAIEKFGIEAAQIPPRED